MAHKVAMSGTKRIFLEMKQCEISGEPPCIETVKDWKSVVRVANAEVSRLSKLVSHSSERHAVDKAVLSEEMRSELVDREANAARTAERFRVIQDRISTSDTGYDKAVHSASVIESAIADLCSHALNASVGSNLLYDKMIANA
jgi:hypothetical protein